MRKLVHGRDRECGKGAGDCRVMAERRARRRDTGGAGRKGGVRSGSGRRLPDVTVGAL